MKRRVLFSVMGVMTLLLVVGATYAQPVPDNQVKGFQICIDSIGYCNDYLVDFVGTGSAFYHVVGKEYGCGDPTRQLNGSFEYVNGVMLMSLYVTVPTNVRIGNVYVELPYPGGVGPMTYQYHYESFHYGFNDAEIVPCPKDLNAITPDGPDASLSR